MAKVSASSYMEIRYINFVVPNESKIRQSGRHEAGRESIPSEVKLSRISLDRECCELHKSEEVALFSWRDVSNLPLGNERSSFPVLYTLC